MKTGNIGIRNIADIGVADIDIYGTNSKKYKAYERTEKIKLRIGVFFDGTGNNRFNSDSVYYNYNIRPKKLIEHHIPTVKHKGIELEEGSSYWNSYSNIALLHDLYEERKEKDNSRNTEFQSFQLKVYIQGIGTLRDEKDDMLGSGMGEGSRGVIARVEQACQQIADEIDTIFKNTKNQKPLEIISIQFDVFGFSRGAAAARHFCNEVLKSGRDKNPGNGGSTPILNVKRPVINKTEEPKDSQAMVKQYKLNATKKVQDNIKVAPQINAPVRNVFTGGELGIFLQKKNINYPKFNVSVEFLGLFDTVISQMLERKGIIDTTRNPIIKGVTKLSPVLGLLTEQVASIKKVNPDLSNPNIKRILHLKAQSEWRDNFPITPIGPFNGTQAKELTVLGAHSDVGGAYWQTEEESHTLHFFDLGKDSTVAEKQKLEEQKQLLRNWYISQRLCEDNPAKLYWETMHHVHSFEGLGGDADTEKDELLPESFMGDLTQKTEGSWTYLLKGYHHRLLSRRPLNNKLSLVYMNVMKHIALNYADVPFKLSESGTRYPEEYKYPENYDIADDKIYEMDSESSSQSQRVKRTDLEKYQNLLIKVAEHGWINKEGKKVAYPGLIDENQIYSISPEMYIYIMGKFVHLSANFDSPITDILEHYNFAYTNVPHFTDEKEFKNRPYERESYSPQLAVYDIS
ncbi:phospholipase effector Tle1 domain-containing protein [Elizabethkingia anophelis]|uniref:phospholipase effector Tle1 domain-containing protein n=1 Tax=Elizabethkingia anophelis TaxID=1117645 RepID=UPI003891B6F6